MRVIVSASVLALLIGCSGAAEVRRGDEVCALLDATVQQRINEAVAAVVDGATLDVSLPTEETCDQTFLVDGGPSLELRFADVSTHSGTILEAQGDGIAVDGDGATSVVLDDDVVVVTASGGQSVDLAEVSRRAALALRG